MIDTGTLLSQYYLNPASAPSHNPTESPNNLGQEFKVVATNKLESSSDNWVSEYQYTIHVIDRCETALASVSKLDLDGQ